MINTMILVMSSVIFVNIDFKCVRFHVIEIFMTLEAEEIYDVEDLTLLNFAWVRSIHYVVLEIF